MPNVATIVSGLRKAINDPKEREVHVVEEPIAISNGNLSATSYTLHMPIVSGDSVKLRGGRWLYSEYSTEAAASGFRGYTFNIPSGYFVVPTGAIAVTSGDTVLASYSYTQEQEYEYQEGELYEYVRDGLEFVQSYRSFGLSGAGVGTSYTISPDPSLTAAMLITMGSKYLVQKDREEIGLIDGIMIKEADVTIDTTKNSKSRLESSQDLRTVLLDILYKMNLDETAGEAALVDTYSTYVATDKVGTDYEANEVDGDHGIGLGYEANGFE